MSRTRLLAAVALAIPAAAEAQNLGPFRQLLAVEPYYAYVRADLGESRDAESLSGFGARLWVNTAPFGVTDKLGVGLFFTYAPGQGTSNTTVSHVGGQLELFPLHKPIGNVVDPFVTAGVGGFRLRDDGGSGSPAVAARTDLAFTPGAGIRIPIPNRFQLRFDVRDAIVFGSEVGTAGGATRTAHNLELKAALGLTF